MCASNVKIARVSGSAKGVQGWVPLEQAQVVYDHPFHAQMEEALIVDFVNPERGPGARVSIELSVESARRLVGMIESALPNGRHEHAGAH